MLRQVETVVAGPFEVNCHLYWDPAVGEGVIIDPGAEADRIIRAVTKAQYEPKAILLTHGHADHIAAVRAIKDQYNIPLYIGEGEQDLLANPSANVSAFFANPIVAPEPDQLVIDEQLLVFGSINLRVLATPGHSPAGVCYFDETEGILFTGDTLFDGSIGRTDLPGGSMHTLIDSIQRKILSLPDSVICYPGHGPQTTVGAERAGNPFLIGGSFA